MIQMKLQNSKKNENHEFKALPGPNAERFINNEKVYLYDNLKYRDNIKDTSAEILLYQLYDESNDKDGKIKKNNLLEVIKEDLINIYEAISPLEEKSFQ